MKLRHLAVTLTLTLTLTVTPTLTLTPTLSLPLTLTLTLTLSLTLTLILTITLTLTGRRELFGVTGHRETILLNNTSFSSHEMFISASVSVTGHSETLKRRKHYPA